MRRVLTPELMDDPKLDPQAHAAALRGLARLNALSRSDALLWPTINSLARRTGTRLSVLDIATGSADVPIALARRAARQGIDLDLHACDISNTALAHANDRANRHGVKINLFTHDALQEPFDRRFDIVTCSLFLHHLDTTHAEQLFTHAKAAAKRALLINDLRRTPAGLAAAWAASRLATRSHIVHVDAVKSVRAAFTPQEMSELATRAGLRSHEVCKRWPWRMLLRWYPEQTMPAQPDTTRSSSVPDPPEA
ncbi:MAG: methyltransferase domain-containing protein [Phycisphaerales bacterium JB054]